MIVGDFNDELGTERLPRQVFAAAPPALATGHAPLGIGALGCEIGPIFPGVSGQRVLAVWRKKLDQLAALLVGEAGANPDMLQRAGLVKKAEQK